MPVILGIGDDAQELDAPIVHDLHRNPAVLIGLEGQEGGGVAMSNSSAWTFFFL